MLARTAEPANQFTRRDAGRLLLASVLLAAAMSFILGLDFLPAQTLLEVGQAGPGQRPGAADRRVRQRGPHRARARGGAGTRSSSSTTSRSPAGPRSPRSSCASSSSKVAPIDAAFAEGVDAARPRGDPRRGPAPASSTRTTGRRCSASTRSAGPPSGRSPRGCWTRSSAPSSATPRSRSIRDGVEEPVRRRPTAAETALGAALIRDLVVPNSSFSQELTEQERDRAAEGVEDVIKDWERGETIVRSGDRVDEVAWEADRVVQPQRGRPRRRPAGRVRGAVGAGDRRCC